MSLAWLGAGLSVAAPRFVSDDPDLETLAAQMWTEGVSCTGREPEVADTVSIRQVPLLPGRVSGLAQLSQSFLFGQGQIEHRYRLEEIAIERAEPSALAHEIGHAWFHPSPFDDSHLVMHARTELLGRCITERLGLPSRPLPRSFEAMRRIGVEHEETAFDEGPFVDEQLHALWPVVALFVAISQELASYEPILGPGGPRTWSDLDALLQAMPEDFPWRGMLDLPLDDQQRLLVWGAQAFENAAAAEEELDRWSRLEACTGRPPQSIRLDRDYWMLRGDARTAAAARAWIVGGDPELEQVALEVLAACAGVATPPSELARVLAENMRLKDLLREERPTWRWLVDDVVRKLPAESRTRVSAAATPHIEQLDPDADGLSFAEEHRTGSDPWSWDTDGNGWWDGYDGKQRGLALPIRGEHACLASVRRRRRLWPRVEGAAPSGDLWLYVDGERRTPPAVVPRGASVEIAFMAHDSWAGGGVRVTRVPPTVPCEATERHEASSLPTVSR